LALQVAIPPQEDFTTTPADGLDLPQILTLLLCCNTALSVNTDASFNSCACENIQDMSKIDETKNLYI
jgi:hypothetical protein